MLLNDNLRYMSRALGLAKIQQGFCAPNPSVGAVVVKNGQIIAEGYHLGPGCAHAELDALNKIRKKAEGATLYVTLEPCCTYGRTPPCTELLIQCGIKKVVFGFYDPNPNVASKGIAALKNAGIECEYCPLPEVDVFYQPYNYWHQTQLPWVIAKLALSLDAKISADAFEQTSISSEALQVYTHQQRKSADAILTTAQTILIDNPQLNVRLNAQTVAKPIYILDRELKMSLSANIISHAKNITVFHAPDISKKSLVSFTRKNIRCIPINVIKDKLSWDEIIKYIGKEGVHYIWVEAGARCFESLALSPYLCAGMLYFSPKILGSEAYPAFSNKELLKNVKQVTWETIGSESICHLKLK